MKQNSDRIINYIPNNGVTNTNKSDKLRVVAYMDAIHDSRFPNKSLLKEPDLFDDLVESLTRFHIDHYAVRGDILQMSHETLAENYHRYVLRLLWRNNPSDPVVDYHMHACVMMDYPMNVHLHVPCIANCRVKRTTKG